jgi:hypothetical protein
MSNEFLTRGLVPSVDDHDLIAGQRVAVAQRDRVAAALAVTDLKKIEFNAESIHR